MKIKYLKKINVFITTASKYTIMTVAENNDLRITVSISNSIGSDFMNKLRQVWNYIRPYDNDDSNTIKNIKSLGFSALCYYGALIGGNMSARYLDTDDYQIMALASFVPIASIIRRPKNIIPILLGMGFICGAKKQNYF